MQQWVYDGDKGRCNRHPSETFARTSTCAKCWDDPGPAADDVDSAPAPTPVPVGCRGTDDHERALLALADHMASVARALIDEDPGHDYHRLNAGAKLVDSALKAYRTAIELAKTREAEFVVRGHLREMRKLKGQVRN